jgi:transcriptional regulator with XRE-family HTH domain
MSENRTPAGSVRRRRHTAKEHGPDPIDIHVGRQLRLARELAGLTQTDIGKELGMSFQVVQKYEQGEIRVSASRLFQLSALLEKPVGYFFEGYEADADGQDEIERDEIDLVRAFRLIHNPEIRLCLQRLLREIGGGSSGTLTDKN